MEKLGKQETRWMQAAIEQARLCTKDVPVGAVLVLNDLVIGRGQNRREIDVDPTAHAEIIAIREAALKLGKWRLNDTTIYTTLEPCPMCAEAIIQARISKVIFGAYDNISGAAGSMVNLFKPGRLYPIPEVIGGIEEESCKNLLIDFFRSKS